MAAAAAASSARTQDWGATAPPSASIRVLNPLYTGPFASPLDALVSPTVSRTVDAVAIAAFKRTAPEPTAIEHYYSLGSARGIRRKILTERALCIVPSLAGVLISLATKEAPASVMAIATPSLWVAGCCCGVKLNVIMKLWLKPQLDARHDLLDALHNKNFEDYSKLITHYYLTFGYEPLVGLFVELIDTLQRTGTLRTQEGSLIIDIFKDLSQNPHFKSEALTHLAHYVETDRVEAYYNDYSLLGLCALATDGHSFRVLESFIQKNYTAEQLAFIFGTFFRPGLSNEALDVTHVLYLTPFYERLSTQFFAPEVTDGIRDAYHASVRGPVLSWGMLATRRKILGLTPGSNLPQVFEEAVRTLRAPEV